jgi:UTP--glucose-1-phosphate uridylyltransferase
LINKCLFPAAGYGTRFLPATKAIPKEMLPILNKPLLQYAVEEALSAGLTNMAIVTGRGKRAIEDHFDNSFELEAQLIGTNKEYLIQEIKEIIEKTVFTYVRQRKMLGLGHAILSAKPLIGDEPFAVILADDLCYCQDGEVISQLIDAYKQYKCSVIAIMEVPKSEIKNYGIIKGLQIENEIYKVTDMVEKPNASSSNLAIIGRYILTPDIFNILTKIQKGKNAELQLTDALLAQAKDGRVVACKIKGKRFDCGSIKGFLDANNYYAKKFLK